MIRGLARRARVGCALASAPVPPAARSRSQEPWNRDRDRGIGTWNELPAPAHRIADGPCWRPVIIYFFFRNQIFIICAALAQACDCNTVLDLGWGHISAYWFAAAILVRRRHTARTLVRARRIAQTFGGFCHSRGSAMAIVDQGGCHPGPSPARRARRDGPRLHATLLQPASRVQTARIAVRCVRSFRCRSRGIDWRRKLRRYPKRIGSSRPSPECERRRVGPELGPTPAFHSRIPTGVRGPTCVFWAGLTPLFTLRAAGLRRLPALQDGVRPLAARRRGRQVPARISSSKWTRQQHNRVRESLERRRVPEIPDAGDGCPHGRHVTSA
jgi:hypothetical protein